MRGREEEVITIQRIEDLEEIELGIKLFESRDQYRNIPTVDQELRRQLELRITEKFANPKIGEIMNDHIKICVEISSTASVLAS